MVLRQKKKKKKITMEAIYSFCEDFYWDEHTGLSDLKDQSD